MNFVKPPLSQQKLVELLIHRGLPLENPEDVAKTRWALDRIGYFRLSGYMLPFQVGGGGGKRHHFRPGTAIDQIIQLHAFDSDLRHHCLEALEQIEVAVRTSICDHLGRSYGSHWQSNSKPFKGGKHQGNLEVLAKAVEFDLNKNAPYQVQTKTHLFITRYYAKYRTPPMPPGWMVQECASFRTWAFVYEALDSAEQKQISDAWKYPSGKRIDHSVLENWLHSLSIMRNRCAHHARITHKVFPFAPIAPTDKSVQDLFRSPYADLRAIIVVIAVMLRCIDPKSMWLRRLFCLLDWRSKVDLAKAAGFQPWKQGSWQNDPLWSF